jgi:hypothetical protein
MIKVQHNCFRENTNVVLEMTASAEPLKNNEAEKP